MMTSRSGWPNAMNWAAALVCILVLASGSAQGQGSGSKLMADGEQSLAAGNYDQAIDQLSKAIKSGSLGKPEMAKAFIARGEALQGKGSHARAVADFTNALWLESLSSADTGRAFALRGRSRQAQGQSKTAADDFKKAEAAQPGISQQVGGTAAVSGGATRTAARSSSREGDGDGFFGSLFGGSDDETSTSAPSPSPAPTATSPSRGASGSTVRTSARRGDDPVSRREIGSGNRGNIFGGIFGGDDEDETPEPVNGRRRLAALEPSDGPADTPSASVEAQSNAGGPSADTPPRRLVPSSSPSENSSGNVQRPGVSTNLLAGSSDTPDRQATPPARQSATLRQAPRPAPAADSDDDEPGFFERIFSGGETSRRETPSRGVIAPTGNGPRRLAARTDGPPTPRPAAPTPAVQPARADPVQRDDRLPEFVNQPRLTDRILANDQVEPTVGRAEPTRLAGLNNSSNTRLQPPSRRAPAPQVNVEPAQLDWNQTTRVERGPIVEPVARPAPTARVASRAAVAAPARRPVAAPAQRPLEPAPQRREVVADTRPVVPAGREVANAPPSSGPQTLGGAVRSAFGWVENTLSFNSGAQSSARVRPQEPAPEQRVVTAQPAQRTRTTYQPPAASPRRQAAAPVRARSSGRSGGYVVQVAARQRKSDAESAARSVASRHGAVLGGTQPYIVRADIPGKGTFYRVRFGPYRSQAQVASICSQLKGRGQDCFATSP